MVHAFSYLASMMIVNISIMNRVLNGRVAVLINYSWQRSSIYKHTNQLVYQSEADFLI